MIKCPVLLVYAGPNGSGKTTVTRKARTLGVYVNADDIKKKYALSDLEAAERAETLRNELLDGGFDFTMETVLSTERNLQLMQKAKAQGYEVRSIYVLTRDVNINITRVKKRCMSGGHDVPEEKIRTRYHRALVLLPQVIAVSHTILVFDNSDMHPTVIYSKAYDYSELYPNEYWSEKSLRRLLGM
jgi:predicted ABC-type ATPase